MGGDRATVVAVSRLLFDDASAELQTIATHQPGHTMPPDSKSLFLQFGIHVRRAVGLAGCRELCTDMRQQDQILTLPATCRAAASSEMPALADIKNIA